MIEIVAILVVAMVAVAVMSSIKRGWDEISFRMNKDGME